MHTSICKKIVIKNHTNKISLKELDKLRTNNESLRCKNV